MKISRCFSYLITACVLTLLVVTGTPFSASAQITLSSSAVDKGVTALSIPYIEDRSGSNSVMQAHVEFNRLRAANGLSGNAMLKLGTQKGFYWIELPFTNNTSNVEWWLTLDPAEANLPSPVKSLTLYDINDPNLQPVAKWPSGRRSALHTAGVPLELASGATSTHLVLVETWPGLDTALMPSLRTQNNINQISLLATQKASLLWLISGAVFGIGIVQLLLTRQAIQGALALNALIVGASVFVAQRSDLIPGLSGMHPVILPLTIALLLGAGASFMLWTANLRYSMKSLICLVPLLLNAVVYGVVVFAMKDVIAHLGGVEYLPRYLLTATGALMLLITLVQGFSNINMYWFLPSWLAFIAIPWMGSDYPYAIPVIYVLLLAVAGVASIYWQWRVRDNETESMQRRLRQEVKVLKDKFQHENENWRKKMDTQRDMLNELRMREQQRASELEVAKKVADEANKAKSDFLAIISHEIRTPMNGIMGIVQILNQTPLNDKQVEYVDVIKNSGDTMLTLLNDILDYSKIEKGVIDLENIPFSLRKLVQSVATLMSGRAKDKGISIQVVIDETMTDHFSGDPQRIRQILLNLVSNAVKFTEKGSVTLRVTPLGGNAHEVPVRFEVLDTGIGISPESQEKLFQAYVQADASISRRFGGTGLGLNICKMLVNAMNGQLGVSSEEGTGSTFWFEIPLIVTGDGQVDMQKKVHVKPVTGRKLYILVIDDNDINLKIVSSLLEMDGHQVVTANSGEKALVLAEKEPFDLIFVDILMPGMNGQTFLKKLRENPNDHHAHIPVYALTGMVDRDSIDEILKMGMLGVLNKPITQEALRDAIQRVYGHLIHSGEMKIGLDDIMAKLDTLSDEEKDSLRRALRAEQAVSQDITPQNVVVNVPIMHNTPSETAMDLSPQPLPELVATRQDGDTDMTYLNMTILGELKDSLPQDTLNEIFSDLITKSKELTTQIEEAATQSDFTDLGEIAHNLKGMAGNFGLQGLMDHSGAIEKAVRSNDNSQAATLVKDSRRVLENSLLALDQWLAS